MLEAKCGVCKETFIPADESDTIHLVKLNGEECGGQGEIMGEWIAPVAVAVLEQLTYKTRKAAERKAADYNSASPELHFRAIKIEGAWVVVRDWHHSDTGRSGIRQHWIAGV